MTRERIVVESWICDDKQGVRASRTERRCRAVVDDVDWRTRWIGRGHPTGSRVCVENIAAAGANAIARSLTKHGSPLGGPRRLRKNERTRRMQASRRYFARVQEADPCPF